VSALEYAEAQSPSPGAARRSVAKARSEKRRYMVEFEKRETEEREKNDIEGRQCGSIS